MKKIFIIAGEASGDLLGSKIISYIKNNYKNDEIKFVGVGGEKMNFEGFSSFFSIKDIAVMGLIEVLFKLFIILSRITFTVKKILEEKPDIIITIDSPDFCFKVMEKLKQKNFTLFNSTKKIHLIAPSVWAYREKRAKRVSKIYDLLLCILPFEPQYFEKYGLKSEFIGHPIFDNSEKYINKYTRSDLPKSYNISFDDIIIILTPGSRESEVDKIYPIMIKTVNILKKKYSFQYKNYHIFTFTNNDAKDMVDFITQEYNFNTKIILSEEEKIRISSCANIVLAKSGTNTLEFTMSKLPMVITYKFNSITNLIVKKIMKIKYANIVNILANKEIIPEYLLNKAKPYLLAKKINELLENKRLIKEQLEETEKIIKILGYQSPIKSIEKIGKKIIELL